MYLTSNQLFFCLLFQFPCLEAEQEIMQTEILYSLRKFLQESNRLSCQYEKKYLWCLAENIVHKARTLLFLLFKKKLNCLIFLLI